MAKIETANPIFRACLLSGTCTSTCKYAQTAHTTLSTKTPPNTRQQKAWLP